MSSPVPARAIQPVSRLCCYQLDPTRDSRWAELVERHPRASVFHSVGWLKALQRTYKYEPAAFTTSSSAGDLKNGLVFCHINSWLTGRRLVSLPFSDHCEPLCDWTDRKIRINAFYCMLGISLLQYVHRQAKAA